MSDPGGEGREGPRRISRRGFLRQAGVVGAGAAAAGVIPSAALAAAGSSEKTEERAGLESLTAAESATLDAILARLIPTDANGPGATEAHVGVYIDRALGGPLSFYKSAYDDGLDQIDEYSSSRFSAPFVQLAPAQQDAILTSMQSGKAAGFGADGGSSFFSTVLQHAQQGMFGDPFWGGNANFVGWDLIGYPGVKITGIQPSEQAVDTTLKFQHKSGYSFDLFKKTTKKETRLRPLTSPNSQRGAA
jgi:gluconate 2-dehydrogenase gamma chain